MEKNNRKLLRWSSLMTCRKTQSFPGAKIQNGRQRPYKIVKYEEISREYVIQGSKIHIESGKILLTLEVSVNRLRRFALPSADLDQGG